MARLYSLASSEMCVSGLSCETAPSLTCRLRLRSDDNEENATRLFGWMPDKLLHSARLTSPPVRYVAVLRYFASF